MGKIGELIDKDSPLLFLFHKVMNALVKERVPIIEKEKIISNFAQASKIGQEEGEIIRNLRLLLKDLLPCNQPGAHYIELPKELENKIAESVVTSNGKTFLSILPQPCQKILADIRELVPGNESHRFLILMVRDGKLRLPIKKLVELEFPYMAVNSREEILKQTPN